MLEESAVSISFPEDESGSFLQHISISLPFGQQHHKINILTLTTMRISSLIIFI